jgi:hypothetical protein
MFDGLRSDSFQQRQTIMGAGETMFARGVGESRRGGPLKRRRRVIPGAGAGRAAISPARHFACPPRAL